MFCVSMIASNFDVIMLSDLEGVTGAFFMPQPFMSLVVTHVE